MISISLSLSVISLSYRASFLLVQWICITFQSLEMSWTDHLDPVFRDLISLKYSCCKSIISVDMSPSMSLSYPIYIYVLKVFLAYSSSSCRSWAWLCPDRWDLSPLIRNLFISSIFLTEDSQMSSSRIISFLISQIDLACQWNIRCWSSPSSLHLRHIKYNAFLRITTVLPVALSPLIQYIEPCFFSCHS